MGIFGNFTKPRSTSNENTSSTNGVFNNMGSASNNTSENKNSGGIFSNFSKEQNTVHWDDIIGKPANLGGITIWGTIQGTVTDQSDLVSWVNGLLSSYVTSTSLSTTLSNYATTTALSTGLAGKQDSLGFTPVPNTRTLTIDGVGYDLTADRSWTISSYTLPIATALVLGGVKIGSGVTVDLTGTISVSTNYQSPLSGNGFVKVSGTTISYDNSVYLTTISGITAGGDLQGTYPDPVVHQIQGQKIQSGNPANQDLLIWDNTASMWKHQAITTITGYNNTNWDTAYSNRITSLNGLTGSTQTFATGTTGTDFTISSSVTTHTFNIPTASASNRGLLSTTDWSTFNNKQATITIGTIDSQAKVANGLVLTSNVLYTQTADASNVGMVSTGTQTFAGAKTFSNAATSSFTITSSNYSAGSSSHLTISPNITANANNVTINAFNINPTLSASTFTGVTLVDLALTRNNPNINYLSGNLTFLSNGTTNLMVRGSAGGILTTRGKFGNVTGSATNVLDVGGDSLFSLGASTPATASARVHIVGSSASSGTALLVTNSTPTTILKVDNNQDLYLGSSGGKIGVFAATPIVKVTTAIAGATRVGGAGTTVTTTDTFGGYTIAQIVQALVNYGWI